MNLLSMKFVLFKRYTKFYNLHQIPLALDHFSYLWSLPSASKIQISILVTLGIKINIATLNEIIIYIHKLLNDYLTYFQKKKYVIPIRAIIPIVSFPCYILIVFLQSSLVPLMACPMDMSSWVGRIGISFMPALKKDWRFSFFLLLQKI